MREKRKCTDWKKAFGEKKIFPAKDVLKYIDKAESNNDFNDIIRLVGKIENNCLAGTAEEQKKLKVKIIQIKRELLESHPFNGLIIMNNRLFWPVCCDEMKEVALKGYLKPIVDDFGSDTAIIIRSPELMAKMQDTDNVNYPDDFFITTNQCPSTGVACTITL